MHFEHPELLYALILLIIPLIVHLFRLRKFQKEDFTNVKFLKKVIQETRKSSQLKKFLILITRLLLITCLVLAFAQPYIPASNKALKDSSTLIYLDNSFSMQASDQNTLLQNAVNGLLEHLKPENSYGFFTNDQNYFNLSTSELKKNLQEIEFTDKQLDLRQINLKAENYFRDKKNTENELLIISDFQTRLGVASEINKADFNHNFIHTQPPTTPNVNLDSAYIGDSNPESFSLNIQLKSHGTIKNPVSISVFNNEQLLGRSAIENFKDGMATINFRLQNEKISNGRIEIEDAGLRYDNKLFFNIAENQPIKTVIISDDINSQFLKKIYTEPEFETSIFTSDQIDFNKLNSANLIILNEIDQISPSLTINLKNTWDNGASLIIIPPEEANDYNQILNEFDLPLLSQKIETERLITNIVYDHPLLEGVFEERTENFDYPLVLSSFNSASTNAILRYQDNHPFLIGSNQVYLFTAALNNKNSNFINSPLIVPVLYQIGLEALKNNRLYYQTDQKTTVDIAVEIGKDNVLHITKKDIDIIPQQQNFSNRVEIKLNSISLEAGNYAVTNSSSPIANISLNYDRSESNLTYTEISEENNLKIYNSVAEYFSEINAAVQITALWKWFVIFALIFIAIEMLLIKFFK
ncbi:BatA domain-containing protein [Christiangramia sp.]|uniref:BatA domain-containing protein n=1 Tax=Christiangramia sp. TaxID=1931228 RepID=UPI002601876F|nr:BatA domain-containing protein [Christiangramia sp.]